MAMNGLNNGNILGSEAVKMRIEAGDITQADVDTLKESYGMITAGTAAGFLAGIPIWFMLGRRGVPPMQKWMATFAAGSGGALLGTSAGGVMATLHVKRNMPDTERKLKVFQEIAVDYQRALQERRAGIQPGTVISHQAGIPAPDKEWTPRELDRATERASASTSVGQQIEERGGSAWDRLRGNKASAPSAPASERSAGSPNLKAETLSPEAEYARRQREFDAMLERERQGGDDADKWSTSRR